jgi:hypothetical protein
MMDRDHDRKLLLAFLARLEETAALSVPAEALTAAIDDTLKENGHAVAT